MYLHNGIDAMPTIWWPSITLFYVYTIAVRSVCNIMLGVLVFYQKQCISIYYHFRHDHGSSGFRKLARSKWICQRNCDYFLDLFISLAIAIAPVWKSSKYLVQ